MMMIEIFSRAYVCISSFKGVRARFNTWRKQRLQRPIEFFWIIAYFDQMIALRFRDLAQHLQVAPTGPLHLALAMAMNSAFALLTAMTAMTAHTENTQTVSVVLSSGIMLAALLSHILRFGRQA